MARPRSIDGEEGRRGDVPDICRSTHKVIFGDSRFLDGIADSSVQLVVTSPPYPMIEMWDSLFCNLNGRIRTALKRGKGEEAFELMHRELDKVWQGLFRKLAHGGFICINIGDATRKIGSTFRLYPNHARVLSSCSSIGFQPLPEILWRKQSNKPNKFMGSGMLPGGAYVTQEHEHILILRKGKKREFATELQRSSRRRSAYFWEERNCWFSDVWDNLKGERQELRKGLPRTRSASFPFELAYRLVSMYSMKGDFVLDPFLGTGTTCLAALALERNSVGYEIEESLIRTIKEKMRNAVNLANEYNWKRLIEHAQFANRTKGWMRYQSKIYGFPVMTKQEEEIDLPFLESLSEVEELLFVAKYERVHQRKDWVKSLSVL